jgi:hypothetical protein
MDERGSQAYEKVKSHLLKHSLLFKYNTLI